MQRTVRTAIGLLAAAAALAGCGGGGGAKTVTVRERTVTVTTNASTTPTSPSKPASGRPSRDVAERYARRTYVVQPQLGRRVFRLAGPGVTVTASDGSAITAYGAVLADSGDGTGQAVLLFRGAHFLGWATDRMATRLEVQSSGSAIAVRYGAFRGNDPLCCPSSTRTVHYSWNGTRVVADGKPPLAYGKQGDPLRLAP